METMQHTLVDPAIATNLSGGGELPLWSSRARSFAWACLLVGVLLRVAFFACDRALWIDEAMVAGNIAQRSYSELLEPLDNNQMAPVGWLWSEKWANDTFGDNERSLRIVPLLAGLLSLPVFLLIARRLLDGTAGSLAVMLFALSEPLVYYSADVKPYSSDVLFALLFFWLALRVWQGGHRVGDLIAWAIAGSVGLLFSYTLVVIIATIGGWLVLRAAWTRQWRACFSNAIACGVCAGVFLLIKRQFMANSDVGDYMDRYWGGTDAFMPLPPKSFDDLLWLVNKPLDFFIDPMRFKTFGLAAVLAIVGMVMFWRERRFVLALLISPVLFVLGMSALRVYPFGTSDHWRHPMFGRVILFSLPLILILIGAGLGRLRTIRSTSNEGRWLVAVVLLVLLIQPVIAIAKWIKDPVGPQHDMRPALAYLEKHAKPGDQVFISWGGMMVSSYYWTRFDLKDIKPFTVTTPGDPEDYWPNPNFEDFERTFAPMLASEIEATAAANRTRLWVLFVHSDDLAKHRVDEKFVRWYLTDRARAIDLQKQGLDTNQLRQANVSLQLFEAGAGGLP